MILWKWKRFSELTTVELYELMVLRQQVFVVEQSCHYLDADGKDVESFHLLGFRNGQMEAYARVVKPNVIYKEASIGRVVTSKNIRGIGAGKSLMQRTIEEIENEFGKVPIRISAQTYLLNFYNSFGFRSTGKEYLEDEIPHTEMLRGSSEIL